MKRFLFLFSVLIPVFGQGLKKEILVTKNEIVIETPGVLKGGSHSWMLKGFLGSRLILTCDNIDIPQSENCQGARLLVRDGLSKNNQIHCGQKSGTFQETRHGFLYLLLDLKDLSGSFKCKAKLESGAPQEDIKFVGEGEATAIASIAKDQVETWDITGPADVKIELSCKVFYVYTQPRDESCNHDFLEVDAGDGQVKRFCGSRLQIIKSTANRLALRLNAISSGSTKNLECTVYSMGGKALKHFKDIASEEIDSSEFGNGIGTKQTTCDCGRANKQKQRVIYGIDAAENEFPWAVSLQTRSKFHFCGGSIVSKRHVVSCAHCTVNKVASETQIVAGGSHLRNSKTLRRYDVLKIINHDYVYMPETRRDISVLITKDEIEFSRIVGPICLPQKDPGMVEKYITAMGWGRIAADEILTRDTDQLKKNHMRIVHPKWCSQVWKGHYDLLGKTHICTWSNHTDICLGDSGGPVTWVDPDTNRYFLVGCPSLCDGCKLQLPSIHTAMYAYFKWIIKTIAENQHPEKVCTKIE